MTKFTLHRIGAEPSNGFYFNPLAFRVMTRRRARLGLARRLQANPAARGGHILLSAPGAIEMVV